MGLPLTSIRSIAAFAGWTATGRLACSGKGSLEIKVLRLSLKAVGATLPRHVLSWSILKLLAEFAGEICTAKLVQAAIGHLETKNLRTEVKDNSAARQQFYGHLADIAHQDYLDQDAALAVAEFNRSRFLMGYHTFPF